MFKKIFIDLCNSKGESPTAVCKALGLSAATFSCWTDDSVPRRATLQRMADYFGVTVDYLLGKEKKPSEPEGADGSNGDLWAKICRLSPENRNKVDGYVTALLDEQYREEIAKSKNA